MWSDRLKILHHFLTILEVETEGHHILLAEGIESLSKLINTECYFYQYLVEKSWSIFFRSYMDQIAIFQ